MVYSYGAKDKDFVHKHTNYSSKVINESVNKLCTKKLITVREDYLKKKYYCVSLNIYKKHSKCKVCVNNTEIKVGDKNDKHKSDFCSKKRCAYNFDFMNIARIRLINKVTKFSDSIQGISYNRDKHDEMCNYYIRKHKLVNSVKGISPPMVKRYIKSCCAILSGIDGVNMAKNQAFYEYVDSLYKKAKLYKKSFVLEQLSNTERIFKFFTKDEKTGKNKSILKCSRQGIYCAYAGKNGVCELADSGVKCTTKITNNMKKKYGEL